MSGLATGFDKDAPYKVPCFCVEILVHGCLAFVAMKCLALLGIRLEMR